MNSIRERYQEIISEKKKTPRTMGTQEAVAFEIFRKRAAADYRTLK